MVGRPGAYKNVLQHFSTKIHQIITIRTFLVTVCLSGCYFETGVGTEHVGPFNTLSCMKMILQGGHKIPIIQPPITGHMGTLL